MVEELIDCIKNAEIKAENDIKDSVRQSREIMRVAGDRVNDMKKENAQYIQSELKKANDEGKGLAEEEYSRIMFDAHRECEDIKAVAEKNSSKAVDFVARGLYQKYGSR